METLTLHEPLDMHLHLRDGDMLKLVGPLSGESFAGAAIMPNLVPPVTSVEGIEAYRRRIESACAGQTFHPYMTLFFRNYTKEELINAREHILGIKLYPAGATTNSEGGVSAMADALPTLELMQELDIPLMVHGESHGFVMDRESEFLHIYGKLATQFPKLRIIMEHITTAKAVELLHEYENLYATVTLQHLLITLDDVIGGMMNPHLFCKPIAKRPEDRESLLQAALSAMPKLMFGSDSAPHPKHKKECCGCAAGVFTAPIALPVLAQLFETHGALDKLQAFISENAKAIYRINPPKKSIHLSKNSMFVPEVYEGFGEFVVPMYAGKELSWSISAKNVC